MQAKLIYRTLVVALVLFSARQLPAQDAPGNRFEKEIKAYEAADATNPPPQGAILFTGASGIRLWKTLAEDFPNHKVINRGFGGSQMSDLVYFADRIILPYKPKMIVVQTGGNDINAGKSPTQIRDDFQTLVTKIRAALPDVRIAFMSSSPSPARWTQREKQLALNALIKKVIDEGKNLVYIETYPAFVGENGQPREELFVADKLHHNAAGYKVRTELVKPHLP